MQRKRRRPECGSAADIHSVDVVNRTFVGSQLAGVLHDDFVLVTFQVTVTERPLHQVLEVPDRVESDAELAQFLFCISAAVEKYEQVCHRALTCLSESLDYQSFGNAARDQIVYHRKFNGILAEVGFVGQGETTLAVGHSFLERVTGGIHVLFAFISHESHDVIQIRISGSRNRANTTMGTKQISVRGSFSFQVHCLANGGDVRGAQFSVLYALWA